MSRRSKTGGWRSQTQFESSRPDQENKALGVAKCASPSALNV